MRPRPTWATLASDVMRWMSTTLLAAAVAIGWALDTAGVYWWGELNKALKACVNSGFMSFVQCRNIFDADIAGPGGTDDC